MAAELSPEQRLSRGIVRTLNESKSIRITTSFGHEFIFDADKKLSHDIALAVQDFFRRKGRDYKLKDKDYALHR